jgi:threonine synthase
MTGDWHSTCLRCARTAPLGEYPEGCGACAAVDVAVPLVPEPVDHAGPARPAPGRVAGMWDWADLLPPVPGGGSPVSLGEGGTPLVDLARPATPGRVLIKDERANPTGSFKDRLCSAAITRARAHGAAVVALATSGNAGLSAAAYAAAAGLDCVVLSTAGLAAPTRAALGALGARLLVTDTAADRWVALRTGVERLGWYPLTNYVSPPVSSNVFGVHAYRTVAYEIAAALDWSVPDWVVVPVSRGDGLYGVWAGFAELARRGWTTRVPRMLAVERFPSLTRALADGAEQPSAVAGDEPVAAGSIGDRRATYMALHTLRRSDGDAVACDDRDLAAAARDLARSGHLYELSSAAVLAGLRALVRAGRVDARSTVVLLGTAAPFAQATLPHVAHQHVVRRPDDPDDLVEHAPS